MSCCTMDRDVLALAGEHACLQSIQTQLKPHLKKEEQDS